MEVVSLYCNVAAILSDSNHHWDGKQSVAGSVDFKGRHFCVLRRCAAFHLCLCLQTFHLPTSTRWRWRCFLYCFFFPWAAANQATLPCWMIITGYLCCVVFLLVHKGELKNRIKQSIGRPDQMTVQDAGITKSSVKFEEILRRKFGSEKMRCA